MMADKSRRAILANAMFVVMAIALGAPAVLAANAVHRPEKDIGHSAARVRQVDRTSAPRAARSLEDVHDPFESMHQE